MNWLLIASIAPALWAITNYIDKHLISRYFKGDGIGALVIFSSLIGILVLPFILIIHPAVFAVKPVFALLIVVNGFLYVLGLLPYYHALKEDEVSIVVPLFQTIPVFSYILALVVLREVLTGIQIFASLLIIAGAVALSLDLDKGKPELKQKVFWLMLLASFLVALNGLVFKFVAIKEGFWTTSFWEYIGFAILSVILLVFIGSYRRQFLSVIKLNRVPVLTWNTINETLNIIAKIIMNLATLLAPLALAWVINGFQPFFVLIFGIIITLFFPYLAKESLAKKHIAQRLVAIMIMFIGVYLLNI